MPMFVGSQSFISLSSFMFVSAVVSEIRELKGKEKNNSFPGHIIYPFFNQRYLLNTCTVRSPLHHKLKVIIKISLSTLRAVPSGGAGGAVAPQKIVVHICACGYNFCVSDYKMAAKRIKLSCSQTSLTSFFPR